jgi:hypothetical protein
VIPLQSKLCGLFGRWIDRPASTEIDDALLDPCTTAAAGEGVVVGKRVHRRWPSGAFHSGGEPMDGDAGISRHTVREEPHDGTVGAGEQVRKLETGLAVQEASMAGAQATQAAAQAGMTSTFTATQTGTWAVMATGGVALLVGNFLGMAIAKD